MAVRVINNRNFITFLMCLSDKWLKLSKMHGANSIQTRNVSQSNIKGYNEEQANPEVLVWLYGSPILIVSGTIGNILSFAVMLWKKIRHTTTSLYLCVLAVVDTAVLYTGLFMSWYRINLNGYDVTHWDGFACKFFVFFLNGLQQFDSWILVSVTLERVCAVFLPHKHKEIFTKKVATVCLIIQALVIITMNNHVFYTSGLEWYLGTDGLLMVSCLLNWNLFLGY